MAYFTPEARQQIIAALPEAASWLGTARGPARHTPAGTVHPGAGTPARTNRYATTCQRCHGHIAEAQGVLGDRVDGKWLVFHAEGQCPDKTDTTKPPTPAPAARRTPNKYPGPCTGCGRHVQAEEGLLGAKVNGRWTVTHDGPCPGTPTPAPARTQLPAPVQETAITLTDTNRAALADLTPAIVTVDLGYGGHTTFRIKIRREDSSWGPKGQVQLMYLAGADNEASYRLLAILEGDTLVLRHPIRSAKMRTALSVLLGDPGTEDLGEVKVAKRCRRCDRVLTTPESIDNGIGPECATKSD